MSFFRHPIQTIRSIPRHYFRCGLGLSWLFPAIALGIYLGCNLAVNDCTKEVYDSIEEVPPHSVALVLGAAPIQKNGALNYYFLYRMNAAAKLYHAGKVHQFLVSGDNGTKTYNEPDAMRQALIERGVPASAIICDYAGFRTLDSVLRAAAVFQQRKFLIVSQRFHCKRAVYLARIHHLDATGFAAQDVQTVRWRWKNHFRESLARVVAVFDATIFLRKPRFYGPTINLPPPRPGTSLLP